MPQYNVKTPVDSLAPQATKTASRTKRTRGAVVDCVATLEKKRAEDVSQRQAAQELGVPRTSLQHWIARKSRLNADPTLIAFFESSTGVAFLHRLVTTAHLVYRNYSQRSRQSCFFHSARGRRSLTFSRKHATAFIA